MIKSVNILVRDAIGRTLLQIRNEDARTAPLLWGFWGGAVDVSDTGPDHAAARELGEELGVDASPDQFAVLAQRGRAAGHLAALLLYTPPLAWSDIRVCEGAGAGFFWRRELLRLPLARPVAWYLEHNPEFFADRPS